MFGGTKPTFGSQTPGTTFSSFNNAATSSPFGQSAFGKPATTGFGATSGFGTSQTGASVFHTTTTQQPSTGLFGTSSTSTAFGNPTATQQGFGAFTQPQQNASIFGTTQQVGSTPSLFGQTTATTAFGSAIKPSGFGQTTNQATPSLFGQPTTSTGGFGTFSQTVAPTSNVFGAAQSSAFGQPAGIAANPGTSIAKYQPTMGTDSFMKSGQTSNVTTKLNCITAMKEYEGKALEELRMEDYLANRKGLQTGTSAGSGFGLGSTTGTGLFGSSAQTSTGLFGQSTGITTDNKGMFGSIGSAFGQPATTGFGANVNQQQNSFLAKPFGATGTTGFGSSATDGSNPFGTKPGFGQTSGTSLFGQNTAQNSAPAFGQTSTGFGAFGTQPSTQTQQPSLFGQPASDANKTAFGLGGASTANTAFGGFGNTATNTTGGGLFGIKPNTGFGTGAGFGNTSTANTGFGNFNLNNASGGSLFNSSLNKPATSGFGGFGTQTSTAAPLNFNTGSGGTPSLFGNNAAKPGGLFGSGGLGSTSNTTGTGLFGSLGSNTNFGNTNALGSNFNTNTLGGMNNTNLGGMFGTSIQQQHQQQMPIHQHILSKVTSPYGDNSIFIDLKRDEGNEITRATNPAAQQAYIENNVTNVQPFRVSTKSNSTLLKLKPMSLSYTKKSLFDGLEEFDSNIEDFTLKPSAKRLMLKPKTNNDGVLNGNTSINSDNNNTDIRQSLNKTTNENRYNEMPKSLSGIHGRPAISSLHSKENNKVDEHKTNGILSLTPITTELGDRRESWLHPKNLEKLRQQNLNTTESSASLNSTLNELVPRKVDDEKAVGNTSDVITTTISEQHNADESLRSRQHVNDISVIGNNSVSLNRSYEDSAGEQSIVIEDNALEEHPTGIKLNRVGYYTIPSLDDLKSYLAEDGSCVVPNFTVGREGYGNVYFGKEIDVAGLNLDEIVHFRNKEVIIYPDDENKPPVGQGLNREAQVTLDQVWPIDKSKHEPIKDPQRLADLDWEGKLRRVCDKNDTRFVEYRLETGSWVFRVKHFSKYGLSDSDEDDVEKMPTDPKKAKIITGASHATEETALKSGIGIVHPYKNKTLKTNDFYKNVEKKGEKTLGELCGLDESAEFMLMDKTQCLQNNGHSYTLLTDNALKNQQRKTPVGMVHSAMISPTATMAKQAGMDSHKIQLMKATFFVDDEDIDDEFHDESELNAARYTSSALGLLRNNVNSLSNFGNIGSGGGSIDVEDCSDRISISSSQTDLQIGSFAPSSAASIIDDRDSDMDIELSQHKQQEIDTEEDDNDINISELPPFIIEPAVAPIKSFAYQMPFVKSLAYPLRLKWPADIGLYYSHRYKFDFGPQNMLIVPTTNHTMDNKMKYGTIDFYDSSNQLFRTRSENDTSKTILQCIKISSIEYYEDFRKTIEEHLNIQLRHAHQHDVEDSDCPYITSDNGTDLIVEHLNAATRLLDMNDMEEYAVSVWSLCLVLWGDHAELEGCEPTSHYAIMCRRNIFSEWLENTLTDKDLLKETATTTKNTYLNHMLNLIMCHKVNEACELALTHDDANLSLLLAQLSSGPRLRQLMEDQLAAWYTQEADKFIHVERLKLFMLVAGVPLMSSAHGIINCLENIEWIQVLALQLWFLCSPTCSITDAVLAYEKCFMADEFLSQPPVPKYLLENEGNILLTNSDKDHIIYDLRFHLLQLFSKRSHPMERLLNPATHTSDPMDYRLSWLLLETLKALGYRHCSDWSEAHLHVNFASQLENYGLWEWSIFVLLHLEERNQRELSIQNILYRYVEVSKDVPLTEKEKFVINNLGVPEKWIDYAKAVKAGSLRQYHLQVKYLLKAKQWSLAHDVIYQHIAPDAIINDNLDYLRNLLSQFEQSEIQKSVQVPNWSNQGQIFLDFIDINEKFKCLKSLKSEPDIEARWETLKPQLADLCSRINLLPCPTAKHRLCQSEIAQNLACLVRGVLLVCPVLNPCLIIKIALERLPLPQEFAQQELRFLLDTLADDLSKMSKISQQQHDSCNTAEMVMTN